MNMMKIRFLLSCVLFLTCLCARANEDPAWIHKLAAQDSDEQIEAIHQLGAAGSQQVLAVLKALSEDALYTAGDQVYYLQGTQPVDAVTGQVLSAVPDNADTVIINNRVRSELEETLAGLKLLDADPGVRQAAATSILDSPSVQQLPLIQKALTRESNPAIRHILDQAQALLNLHGPDAALRLKAAQTLGESNRSNVRNALLSMLATPQAEPDESVRKAIRGALKSINNRLAVTEFLERVFSGISLGSILMLTALGLAITYGVMGVINMAHGEFLMVGAYATYAVQSWFRGHVPNHQDAYLLAAIPVAFLAAALVGMVLERTVVRWLYGRPLETLLATWGLSLMLIQSARLLFGAQNVELANPSWMSGTLLLPWGLELPWNRIEIIAFSVLVLMLVWLIMNQTRLGLYVRAVTQNRPMAGCMGIHTAQIDTLAFGLGAGIAGLGGLALSQVTNVGPDMGQGYIVDSFMVVVLGGVGQLAGAVWASLGLGIASKFLEGWVGAVIAKIIVLGFIIVFIQRRPQGLFAFKGRSVDNG